MHSAVSPPADPDLLCRILTSSPCRENPLAQRECLERCVAASMSTADVEALPTGTLRFALRRRLPQNPCSRRSGVFSSIVGATGSGGSRPAAPGFGIASSARDGRAITVGSKKRTPSKTGSGIPAKRLELLRCRHRRILSPLRLPFRHAGICQRRFARW